MKPHALIGLVLSLFISTTAGAQKVANPSSPFSYQYKGQTITLNPSHRYVAIGEKKKLKSFIKKNVLLRDALSDRTALQQRKLSLYRLPLESKKSKKRIELQPLIKQFQKKYEEMIQPVFEQGQALLIPSDELILGFDGDVSVEQARTYIKPHMEKQGVSILRKLRPNTFIVRIERPSNGRVFQVCRYLSALDDIDFAEPNHIVVFLGEPERPMSDVDGLIKEVSRVQKTARQLPSDKKISSPLYRTHASVSWDVLIKENFEAPGTNLPSGWSTSWLPRTNGEKTEAFWAITKHRSHSGAKSLYATGGGPAGVPAPGNYPNNALSLLSTPTLNLKPYEEVYIELWFYARYGTGVDLGYAIVQTPIVDDNSIVGIFIIGMEDDPTTANGWRRALMRVPPRSRVDDIKIVFYFGSDEQLTGEGLYIDSVRILGTKDPVTDLISHDKYSGRQYEMNNSGQIAGIGTTDKDMHLPEAWEQVPVSPDVVVAVIDSGVDKTHEDLTIFEGYEPDGSSGGAYRPSDGSFGHHGTAVAGNVGAIGDNTYGVIGAAPGVKIMPIYIGSTIAEIASAIDVAVEKGADILSNSWGFNDSSYAVIESAVLDALHLKRTVVFAAGNGPDRDPYNYDVFFPANLTGSTDVICVGASSPSDEHKSASSSDGYFYWGSSYVGHGPDVVAPSPWSYTTDIVGDKGYNPDAHFLLHGSLIDPADAISENYTPTFGGTSSSTPKVAGVAALMLSANPNLTPRQIKRILRETADDIDIPGFDDKTGGGRVNAYRAVMAALDEPAEIGMPAGTVVAFSGRADAIPNGWMLCDGREISRSDFRALFYAIRTTYGAGDGSTTFKLPDYRGYFLRGVDHGTGRDPDASYRTVPGTLTPEKVGSIQQDTTRITENMRVKQGGAHSHQYKYTKNHHHNGTRIDSFDNGGDGLYEQTVTGETSGIVVHRHDLTGGGRETRPINSYVNWIIKH